MKCHLSIWTSTVREGQVIKRGRPNGSPLRILLGQRLVMTKARFVHMREGTRPCAPTWFFQRRGWILIGGEFSGTARIFPASTLLPFFNTQFQNYVSPTATLYAYIKATSPLESHFIRVNAGIEELIRCEN